VKLRFNDALRLAAEVANDPALPANPAVGVIRDIYGQLRFAVNAHRPEGMAEGDDEVVVAPGLRYPQPAHQILMEGTRRLGGYASASQVLYRDDFSFPDEVFSNADWFATVVPGPTAEDGSATSDLTVRLLERQVIAQDWLRTQAFKPAGRAPRVVFYGLKGGVGRSSALAMTAYRLARQGRRVLLLDFDLESPGLSGLLLPPDRVAPAGLIDWFIEEAVAHDDGLLADLVSDSPLAEHTHGAIRVATAMGQGEPAYLSKLARVYASVPSAGGPQSFADRMTRLVDLLEQQEAPDVILIDSRAGLHDVAAIAISRLATVALLFASDTEQSWQGYRQLFSHWQHRPAVLRDVRDRLVMVQAMLPEMDAVRRADAFLERSYALFSEHLYDQIDPGDGAPDDAFTYDLHNQDAPHYPMRIRWNARFQEFNPLQGRDAGGVDDQDIELTFGPFIDELIAALPGIGHASR
jgi:cellulose biosynthesis protein BcsQ